MDEITRRAFLARFGIGLAATGTFGVAESVLGGQAAERRWPVTPAEALEWHRLKDSRGGPTLTGSESWRHFTGFLEEKLREYGCVDFVHNRWSFDRWVTSEWPDASHWSLAVAGEPIAIASYGANSGSTPDDGTTAQLEIYDPAKTGEAYRGKIVVFQPVVTSKLMASLDWDYEYASPAAGYPNPAHMPAVPRTSQAMTLFAQLPQFPRVIPALVSAQAVGCLFVVDAGAEQAAGLYTFPVPALHSLPSLFLDRNAGATVEAAALRGASATLRLIAETVKSEAVQTIAFLPGRKYGKPDDEIIQLTTHTDGPSISQDNGALGLLGLIKHFGQLPRSARARTLMVFLDCRHYMPGDEHAFAAQDWFARNPLARNGVVGLIHMEHLGQIGYFEDGDRLVPIGQTEPFSLWATNNDWMIDTAIRTVKATGLPGARVRNVDRPGIHGRSQGPWFGLGGVGRQLGIPAFGIMGLLGAYWTSASRVDRFDPVLFSQQVATFAQLTAELMDADLASIRSARVEGNEALKLVHPE